MIVQPDPIDPATITGAVQQARGKKDLPALGRLRYERWEEGRCAQVLHVGPYADEGLSTGTPSRTGGSPDRACGPIRHRSSSRIAGALLSCGPPRTPRRKVQEDHPHIKQIR